MSKYNQQAKIKHLTNKANLKRLLNNPMVQRWCSEDMSCQNDGGTLAPSHNKGFDHTSNKYSPYIDTRTETKDAMPDDDGGVRWFCLKTKEDNCEEVRFIISDHEGRGSSKKHLKGLELDGLSMLIPHDTLYKRDSEGKHVYLTYDGDCLDLTKKTFEQLYMKYKED